MIKTRLVKLLSHARKYIVYQVLWQWLSLLCQVALVFQVAALLEAAFGALRTGVSGSIIQSGGIDGALSQALLFQRGAVIVGAIAMRFLCDRQASYASYKASADVKRVLRDKIYEKLLKLGASYRESVATSEVVQMAAEGVEQLETYFGRYLPQFFYSMLAPLTLFGILSFVNWKASVVLLLCVPLIPASIVAVQKLAKRLLNRYWGIYTELGDSFLENLQGLTTLKICQADEAKAVEMEQESQRFRRITMKVLTMQLNSTSVMDMIAYGGVAVGMIVVLAELGRGNVPLSGAMAIILLASEFFIPLRLLGSFFHIAMNGMAASDKIFALLDLPEERTVERRGEGKSSRRQESDLPEQEAGRPERESGWLAKADLTERGPLDIRLRNVQFSYAQECPVLQNISLSLPSGSFTALVGTSGCGKSTIAGMLMGRNCGYSGSILVQGRELSEISEQSLMSHITLVSHNSYLFKGSVRENLLMGKADATEQELWEALEQVRLRGFLERQQGLDTPVQEKGSNFSGGQCQRLALARALLHDTPMYIFDEATSNIDVESEEAIMQVIRELSRTKTILLISHRLANVVDADRIYMLEKGCVAQKGTHRELMAQGGAYKSLYQYQQELETYATGTASGKTGKEAAG